MLRVVHTVLQERRLLRWLYGVTLALLLTLFFLTYLTFDRYRIANAGMRGRNDALSELGNVLSSLKDAETASRGFILTHEATYADPFVQAGPAVQNSFARIDSLARAEHASWPLDTLKELSQEMLRHVQDQFLMERTSPIGLQGTEAAALESGRRLMNRIRSEQGALVKRMEEERDLFLEAERSANPIAPVLLAIYGGLAVMATALLFWRLFAALAKAERAEDDIKAKVDQLDAEVRTREFAERSLKRVLDSSPSGIMAFRSVRDRSGVITDLEWIISNQEGDRMLGRLPDELIGKRLLDVVPDARAQGLFDAYVEVVETGRPHIVERWAVLKEGLWLHVHAVRLLDGLVVTFTDISERKRVQELLVESDRLAVTGGIARTIAHEVRNPLTNLHMALEQLLEEIGPEKAEEALPFAEILKRNMNRISKLITDLLESSRPRDLTLAPCTAADLLNDALLSVQDRLELQHMVAEVELEEGLEPVHVDRSMVDLALTNLCINAVEAMEPGKGLLTLSAFRENEKMCIRVGDNGKGIAPENIQLLFQAFYSSRVGGMGLGLTTARNILNAHRVHLDVDSNVGEGTRFTLTFPSG